jgi:hypothetical protein
MDLLGDIGYVESRFNPFGIVVVSVQDRYTLCAKHRSEIVLDAPDGTPR